MSPRPFRRGGGRPPQRSGGNRGQRRPMTSAPSDGGNATAVLAGAGREVELPPFLTVSELAVRLGLQTSEVIRKLIDNGVFATINQELDYDTAAILAGDLGFEVKEQQLAADGAAAGAAIDAEADAADRVVRPPVVTVMGHVDHGKTSLLDAVRKTHVVSGEAGGITQHIGAYQVEVEHEGATRRITFLDTPGHEAFTAMRARGAQVTDIAILVVAADDGVMPQTREAIDHARAATVPIVVALNKIDRPNANPDRVKQQLASEANLVIREYGGEVECVPVSAKTGEGIDDLLDTVLFVADAEVEPKANPNRAALGAVVEAKMDPKRGSVATVLVQEGTLNVGDPIVVGGSYGRVRSLFNDRGKKLKSAEPAMPVEILGLSSVPTAGDRLVVVADERTAQQLATQHARLAKRDAARAELSLEDLYSKIKAGEVKELNLLVKADVSGSVEPIVSSLERLSEEGVRIKVVRANTGNITESDVLLAVASKAIIIGFNVRIEPGARRAADAQGIDVRFYDVIYRLVEDVEQALQGLAGPKMREVVHGHAEVRQIFKIGRNYAVAGCLVLDGTVYKSDRVRLSRNKNLVYEGKLSTLRRFKDDVREVTAGYECGIGLDEFHTFVEGDVIESYGQEEISRSE
ncbi:MAG: translation initiation factor IF-2 [Chloroflexi bacterium]|nr:translation initiation factor IF-2 [Chloroflexota bacterium]